MVWRPCFLDLALVPSSLLISLAYHIWLWRKIRTAPLSTIIGINSAGRRRWVAAIMEDNDKKNILAVQTIRNAIMGSTLMATTSILLCCGLGAVISSTYSVKKSLSESIYGAHGEFMVGLKYAALLAIFIFAFLCYSLSVRFINQANFLLNVPTGLFAGDPSSLVLSPGYVSDLLEKGFVLNTVGNRLFYAALPLLLWIFGPSLVFLTSITMVPILYNLDVSASTDWKGGQNGVGVEEKTFV
ncbi:unnamed protein product [Spirodela intermedia]|uniref:Uncharacterized protein n=1 Tax=Spirodela intermedia TaxID=51605 RepID=A0A7I8KME5_SPIIN|nr:unnamed protein product [Spirodela intermedia]